ncbi:MAG: crotonase/enoyl-CoA hydratase family protein [Gammaproteobacteria bacterium]|nr:crotonase/enoyl-CoA hydratase family protein [Gammaproteobacteria bacterium]MDH3858911.1 crotonase/enoyl-CoA hydratase family protein [Gammaproteobacteria bacterium]
MSNVAYISEVAAERQTYARESQLKTYYDTRNRIIWLLMKGAPRPAFTLKLLNEITSQIKTVQQDMAESDGEKYDFLVLGSDIEGVFNLGGDLDQFCQYIRNRDRDGLLRYAKLSIDLVYQNLVHFGADMKSISLIQGDALGGGFEAAFSANIVVAERGTKCGLPEVLFNMFPGMGAFSILSRKIGFAAAEKMIMSGGVYSAEKLYDMGLVDILAEKGEGEVAIYQYIKSTQRSNNAYRSMQQVKDICNQVSYQELIDIGTVWADAALKLSEKDLRMMQRLVRRQNNRMQESV